MRLGIVYNNLIAPTFAGGGSVHSYEVVMRLKKEFEVIYYPSSPSLKWPKEKLIEKAKELESSGIRLDQGFYSILDTNLALKKSFLNPDKISEVLSKYYDVDKVDFLYEPDHTSFDIYYLGAKHGNYGLTIHEPLYYSNSFTYLKRLIKFYGVNPRTGKGFHTRFLYNELVSKRINRKLISRYPPRFIASVSKGSLEWSGIDGDVINPGNAFDSSLLKYRNRGKEDYVVFWSRLNQDKGIREVPDIMRVINSKRKAKLLLMGKFFDKYNEEIFWRKIKKYDIDVEYLGFVDRDKLNDVVSKAKCLIYPSHVDGFSLVVLESLALGTPVVAYDIPTVKSVYSGLPGVTFVPEFDVKAVGEATLKFLQMDEAKYNDMMNDERLLEFLEIHSSWDNVARSVKEIISRHIKG
ncbi:glycosyltransferase family 4 protein [Sulfuracidifex tepidarius]|uniref:D-inositol-3-phosphate glycosyltransferase n=1 Tax=Sulfuracidifex tepidarius TaxID=1294262 RepID=A0A510DZJ5_9CREN|nr:glycosyltransferase [Sulfuracidifex tepidarius]BBG22915.1 D-inositol-3-phosphate glycosyltransferase [Sulfuracidifex tepidarius]BBG25675.1 D-inositol-3-phosphate glycosyltransferase [Sulfuracidifex tepidarius]